MVTSGRLSPSWKNLSNDVLLQVFPRQFSPVSLARLDFASSSTFSFDHNFSFFLFTLLTDLKIRSIKVGNSRVLKIKTLSPRRAKRLVHSDKLLCLRHPQKGSNFGSNFFRVYYPKKNTPLILKSLLLPQLHLKLGIACSSRQWSSILRIHPLCLECHFKPFRLCKIGMRHPVGEILGTRQ